MIRYAFDLYPRAEPKDGPRVRRLSHLQSAEYRADGGTNSGSISLRATSPDGADIDPEGLQYIRVVRINTAVVDGGTLSGFSEAVVGGFFLENGDYKALSEKSEKLLTFKGAGTLSYLDRAIQAHLSYLTDPFIGHHPFDDRWRLWAAGTGNELGAILWRVIRELQEAGRPQNPIPDLTLDFTYLVDSNAAAWVQSSGDFEAQVGERVLMVVKRLMEMGLWVEMDPDTFELRAYEPGTHARDRTGGAWGANVIRFQAPSAGTVPTGNIKSDATRGLGALIRRSDLMVGANDIYEWHNAVDVGVGLPTAFVWEGAYRVEDASAASFEDVATQQLQARADAGDVVRLRGKLGNSPATGYYLPFEHVRVDDVATLDTGSGPWDWDETEQKVAAVAITLREGGDWDFLVDLGSQYNSIDSRAFAIQGVGPHTHPLMLCDPDINHLLGLLNASLKASDTDMGGTTPKQAGCDGAIGTHWSGDIGTDVPGAWWAADMGVTHPLHKWRVHQNGGDNGATGIKMYGATAGSAWSWLVDNAASLPGAPTSNGWTLINTETGIDTSGPSDSGRQPLDAPGTYRYVLFEATGGGNDDWDVHEFEAIESGGCSEDIADECAAGTSKKASRCDHVHAHGHLTGDSTYHDADQVRIDDAGGHFTATEVEGALQELADAAPNLTVEEDGGDSVPDVQDIIFDGAATVVEDSPGVARVTVGLAPSSTVTTKAHGAKARASGTQNIAHNTITKMALDTAVNDPDGYLDLANDRATVPAGLGGRYRVLGTTYNETLNPEQDAILFIRKNGASIIGATQTFPKNGQTSGNQPLGYLQVETDWLDLDAGDFVELYIYIDSATGGTPSGGPWAFGHASDQPSQTSLTLVYIGPTALSGVELDYLDLVDQGTDPATPAAGLDRLYTLGGVLFIREDDGTITQVGGGANALDDLTDVIITSPQDADRLRYNGSEWVNSNLHWEPMVDYDGLVMLDSGGNPHMHEVSH